MGLPSRSLWQWLWHWIPAALGVAMIAAESTAMMSSNNTSHWLLPIWVRLFGPISATHWAQVHFLIRKTGHFVGYGLVCAAFFHGWKFTFSPNLTRRGCWMRSALLAISSTFVIASADEYHQSFLPGRSSSVWDVALDVCGAIAAQIIIFTLAWYFSRKAMLRNV